MKKGFSLVSLFVLCLLIFSCGKKDVVNETNDIVNGDTADEKIKIVTTIFPEYDFVREIIGENSEKFDVSILLDSGVDLHNYQPTMKDMLDINEADLFVYVGGESDAWVERVLEQTENSNLKTLNLMQLLGNRIKEEELVAGMEEEDEEADEEEIEYDEHIWLSVINVKTICNELCNAISMLDKSGEDIYRKNLDNYLRELSFLDDDFARIIATANTRVILFGDRFPFRYLVDDYGLKYYAAFKGCSAETEASFNTIRFLADKLDEENLKYVMTIDGSDKKIADAIISNSKGKSAEIETMFSLQAVSSDDIKNGESYLSYMKKNLEVLSKVLN